MSGPVVLLSAGAPPGNPRAAHLQRAFAQRHVPLPGPLAEALASLLEARQPFLAPVWGQAFATSARALGISGAVASQSLLRAGIARFPAVVAEPLLREAARRTGVLPLNGAALGEATISDAERKIDTALHPLLRDPDAMGRPFWVRVGLDLHQNALEALRRKARGANRRDLPRQPAAEIDAPLAALVFLHPPSFPPALTRPRRLPRARHPAPHRRSGIKPREGGVVGIRHSRSLEDLPESLFSELILPRQMLAMKLLHEGILVRHRPPRRMPRRDLLALTLQCAGPGDGMGVLIDAAFADAAIRLRIALAQRGLANSDLVWAHPSGRTAHLDTAPGLPDLHLMQPLNLPDKVRADLLIGSGLFPDFATLRPAGELPAGDTAESGPRPALPAALRAGLSAIGPRSPRAVVMASAQDHAHRFILLSRPFTGRRDPEWPELRAEIAALTARRLGRCRHAALVWRVPPPGAAPARAVPGLIALADGREPLHLAPPEPGGEEGTRSIADFLGELVRWIHDVTLGTLDAKA